MAEANAEIIQFLGLKKRCFYCGQRVGGPGNQHETEHYYPWSRCKKHERHRLSRALDHSTNKIRSCRNCNIIKDDEDPQVFMLFYTKMKDAWQTSDPYVLKREFKEFARKYERYILQPAGFEMPVRIRDKHLPCDAGRLLKGARVWGKRFHRT